MDNNQEFGNYLNEVLARLEGKEFKPAPYYDKESDFLVYYHRNVQSYEKWLSPYISLFLSTEDDSFVGFEVNGLKEIIKNGFPKENDN